MPNEVLPDTASALRRLAAKRDRQEEALRETRRTIGRAMHKAIRAEGASPTAVGRLAGISRVQVWKTIKRVDGGAT